MDEWHDRLRDLGMGILCVAAMGIAGCRSHESWRDYYQQPEPPKPLGALTDPVWQNQEANAEASDFVIHEHEFEDNSPRLNLGGEDHVKQIAARLNAGQDVPVVVERGMSGLPNTGDYRYPVHPDPQLDMQRREMIVRALTAMNIADAEHRVVVAPAYASGLSGNEAESSYSLGLTGSDYGTGSGNFGGFILRGGY